MSNTVWLLMTDSLCQGPIPGEWEDGSAVPVFYGSEAEAHRALADVMAAQWRAMAEGHLEDVTEYWVEGGDYDGEGLALEMHEWSRAELGALR